MAVGTFSSGGASLATPGGGAYKGSPHQLPQPSNPASPKAPPAAGQKGAPHMPSKPQGTAGHWIQQGGNWTLIHAVGPGQWAKGAKPGFNAPPKPTTAGVARAAGTRAATAQQPYNPLDVMTTAQITRQANQTVQSAYSPVYTELNLEGSQEQAIYSKQQADNQYFQQWLDSKAQSVQTAENAVQQSTSTLESQILGATTSAMGAQPGQLEAQAAQSGAANPAAFNPGESALGNYLGASESVATNSAAAAAQRGVTAEGISQSALGQGETNAASFLQAGAQKESAAFQTAMNKIATTRAGDVAKESSDIEKEIARLQGVNISVAENNRNYDTAAAKLGVSIANTNSLINQRAANVKIAQQNANTSAAKGAVTAQNNAFDQWYKGQTLNLDQKKFIQTVINDNATNALKAAQTYKDTHGGTLTLSEQNTQIFTPVDKVTATINNLISNAQTATGKLTPAQAYEAMLQGGYQGVSHNSKGQAVYKWITVPRVANSALLNAGYNLRQGGPGLSQGDAQYLQNLGGDPNLIQQHYGAPYTSASQISQGGANSPH